MFWFGDLFQCIILLSAKKAKLYFLTTSSPLLPPPLLTTSIYPPLLLSFNAEMREHLSQMSLFLCVFFLYILGACFAFIWQRTLGIQKREREMGERHA